MKLSVVLAGALVLLGLYTAVATARVERAYPPLGDFVSAEGVRLHYVERGPIDAPTVVLLHGASASLRDFEASILADLALDHRVIAFDRPGYGYSDRPNGAWPDPAVQAGLIRGALQALGVEQPVLVGHSWSGAVVLAYMLNHAENTAGGVLLAGAINSWEGGVSWFNNVAGWPVIGPVFVRTVVFPLGQLVLNSAVTSVFAPDEPTPGYLKRTGAALALRPGAFRSSAEDVRNLNGFLARQSERYDEISGRLLLITGDADKTVPAWNHTAPLAARLPQADRVDLPGVGHALHHSRSDKIADLIRGFAEG